MSVIETPENLKEVKNFYSEIDRSHVTIRLLTSVAKSPSGRHTVAASNSFIFEEPHGQEPDVIHEDWDYNMHLAKFKKRLKAEEAYRFSVVGSVSSLLVCAGRYRLQPVAKGVVGPGLQWSRILGYRALDVPANSDAQA